MNDWQKEARDTALTTDMVNFQNMENVPLYYTDFVGKTVHRYGGKFLFRYNIPPVIKSQRP